MPMTPEQDRALIRLEQAGVEPAPSGPCISPAKRRDTEALYQELRAISIRSAEQLAGREQMTEDDLYDENGLPA